MLKNNLFLYKLKSALSNSRIFLKVLCRPSRVLTIISDVPSAKIKIERVLAVFRSINQKLGNCNFNLRELFQFASERLKPSSFSIEIFGWPLKLSTELPIC